MIMMMMIKTTVIGNVCVESQYAYAFPQNDEWLSSKLIYQYKDRSVAIAMTYYDLQSIPRLVRFIGVNFYEAARLEPPLFKLLSRWQTNDKIGRFYRTTKNRPIFVSHDRFYRSSVIGFRLLSFWAPHFRRASLGTTSWHYRRSYWNLLEFFTVTYTGSLLANCDTSYVVRATLILLLVLCSCDMWTVCKLRDNKRTN